MGYPLSAATDHRRSSDVGGDGSPTGSDPPPVPTCGRDAAPFGETTQFRNATLLDAVGVEINIHQLDADSRNGNFAVIGAATVVTSERGVEQYHAAIEGAVDAVFADPARRDRFIGCAPSGAENDACVRGFLQTLGLRAWRRPLEAAEVGRLAAVAAKARGPSSESAVEGARWATVALFTSPNFLYRPELRRSERRHGSVGSQRDRQLAALGDLLGRSPRPRAGMKAAFSMPGRPGDRRRPRRPVVTMISLRPP